MSEGGHPLAALGLTAAQAAAYELVVDHPDATAEELVGGWSDDAALPEVLEWLVAAGLVRVSPGRPARYVAVPPRAAFDAQLAEGWRQLHDLREQVDRLARDGPGQGVVELVTGSVAVHERLSLVLGSADREVRRLAGPRPVDPAVARLEPELLARGVICRVVCQHPLHAEPAPAGVQVRQLAAVPVTMYLVDDRLAVVSAGPDRYRAVAALVVRESELLHVLGLLFENLWDRAGAPRRPAPPIPERLVELLLTGLTDDAIGRALAVSPRTVQRRIAAMMAAAGARTRFQAGVQAALRRQRSDR